MHILVRHLARLNAATIDYPHSFEAFARDNRAVERAMSIVPYLYFFLLFVAFSTTSQWFRSAPYAPEKFDPIWPVRWLEQFPFDAAVDIVCLMFLAGMLTGAVFFSRRVARIIAFLSFWQFHAFLSSFGTFEHATVVWFYPLLFLTFLPDIWRTFEPTVAQKKTFLLAFFGAQAYTGIVYFLAGLGKVWDGVADLFAGNGNFLSPDAFALHISYWLDNTGSTSVLGPLVVENPFVGWPFFLFMLYMQICTLWAVFRPTLHRVWGALLISFHIATFLTMNILFINSIFLLAALFLNSPFERPETTWRERMRDLPIFGLILRRFI